MRRNIMKYILRTVRNGTCRLGTLSDLRCTETELETPLCMLYTRGGTVPYMTPDMVNKLRNRPQVNHIPLTWISEHHEALQEFGQGIKAFANLQKNQLIYCSLQDPATSVPSGYNDKNGVGVWGNGGKLMLDVEVFMRIQESCQPDWYQALSDGDTNEQSSKKRISKSVDRTLKFLDGCLEHHSKSHMLKKTAVLGVIEGGYDVKSRIRSAKETAARNVQGFVIEGFHNMGRDIWELDFDKVFQDVLKETLDELPENKPRILHGAWSPQQVLEAIVCGVDVFDSSYAYIVTERDCALTFSYDYKNYTSKSSPTVNEQEILTGSTTNGIVTDESRSPGEINLSEKRYYDDFAPILHGCECYTCQRFSRAYINHLINASELLSRMLLMMHNMHHYIQFFEAVRDALQEDKFNDLRKCIFNRTIVNMS